MDDMVLMHCRIFPTIYFTIKSVKAYTFCSVEFVKFTQIKLNNLKGLKKSLVQYCFFSLFRDLAFCLERFHCNKSTTYLSSPPFHNSIRSSNSDEFTGTCMSTGKSHHYLLDLLSLTRFNNRPVLTYVIYCQYNL